MTITGDDNIVPLVESVVEKGALKIRWSENRNLQLRYKKLDIVVNLKSIDGIRLGGSGYIHADRLKAGNLNAALAGSGDIVLDALEADSLQGSIAGSGALKADRSRRCTGIHTRRLGRPRGAQARNPARHDQRAAPRRNRVGDRIADRDDRRLGQHPVLRQAAGDEDRGGLGRRPA